MNEVTNIMVVGIGGQGVMTAAEILADAALRLDHDVKKTEVAGMAQRGGVVTSQVRFGACVKSPVIIEGQADVLLSFEQAEALRWQHWLKADGVLLVNDNQLAPPVVNLGLFDYPENALATLHSGGRPMSAFNATAIALELGNVKLVNTVMLGAVAEALPFSAEHLLEGIVSRFRQSKPHLVALNERAFNLGRAASASQLARVS
ncbi:MAG: indolepyruvate oxidoreductase subunit beta [Gammaproteobacteria bacterium]|jgi:indolepyruvate ferredoxin oxidoreductase beta subunit|nr:indolepyruvate oxidoreductase subunit beta [Gammaproteobacteria bacterium]MDP6164520.1 indolepyruvate oxidoreductase subunit beta [Gammaproteobacteria bacterium]